MKKYGIGYKLFEMNEKGVLFPLFIGKNKESVMNEWIPAENITNHPGFADRPGWHCSQSTPDAPWLRGYDGSDLGPYRSRFKNGKRVWCEVLYDMTDAIHSQFASGLVDYAKYWAIGILYDIITGEECVLKLLSAVEKTGDFANEEIWKSAALELDMKLTEQEILEWYKNG